MLTLLFHNGTVPLLREEIFPGFSYFFYLPGTLVTKVNKFRIYSVFFLGKIIYF